MIRRVQIDHATFLEKMLRDLQKLEHFRNDLFYTKLPPRVAIYGYIEHRFAVIYIGLP